MQWNSNGHARMPRLASACLPILSVWLAQHALAQGMPIGFQERFALAADRAAALAELIPGTPEYYYYSCLHWQHEGELARVDELLASWRERHGRGGAQDRIEARQAFLRFGEDPAATYEYLLRRLSPKLDHQRVVPGAPRNLPHRLDPSHVSGEAWLDAALASDRNGLGAFEDHALERLVGRNLSDRQVTELLSRLERPDVPGLAALVVRQLGFDRSSGFGSLAIHQRLLLSQLDECAGSKPELLEDKDFIDVYLLRLWPSADESLESPEVLGPYLGRLERFVARLAPAFDALRAHVLYHRLVLDLEQGTLDGRRLVEYARVARQPSYTEPRFLRDRSAIDLGQEWNTGLPRVGDDDAVVREYLSRLLVDAESFEAFAGTFRRDYLQRLFAETKILAGASDMERWYSLLDDPAYYERLKERVEIEFLRGQQREFGADERVTLQVDTKNVETLIVKVFEIDALAFYESQAASGNRRIRDVDASIDLDGLVAHEETTYSYDDPPLRRVRRTFEFPRLAEPGIFVVELIGNGMSSRAVVRKGGLTHVGRIGAAGHVMRIYDRAGRHVTEGVIRFGGRDYPADERGEITIPFSTAPGSRQIILRSGELAVLDEFEHRAEEYRLDAGIYVDREALLAGKQATVVVRPRLSVAGERISVGLVTDPTLHVTVTDIDGTPTTSTARGFALHDDRESTYVIQVPPRARTFEIALSGEIASLSEGTDVALRSDTARLPVNGIDETSEVASPLLTRTPAGYRLEVRGKNGEPLPARAVHLAFKHRDFRNQRHFTLETDADGRVELGPLDSIASLSVSGIGSEAASFDLVPPARSGAPSEIHVIAGTTVRVPYEGRAARPGPSVLSVLELRGGQYAFDRIDRASFASGYVELSGLGRGDYRLVLEETGQWFDVRVTDGTRAGGHALGDARRLELSSPLDLQIAATGIDGEDLVIQLVGAGPRTRVHVSATRYLPPFDPHERLALWRMRGLGIEYVSMLESLFVSGRKISDEYRYILDRRHTPHYPGNMLARAGVILNPWAIDEETEDALPGQGGMGGRFGGAHGGKRRAGGERAKDEAESAPARRSHEFSNLDFLAESATVLPNLVADASGVVRVPLAQLGAHPIVRVVAADDHVTISRTVIRPESPVSLRDRRLVGGFDPSLHLVEQRKIEFLAAGVRVVLPPVANASAETFDSLDDVFRLFVSSGGGPELAKFEFLVRWPSLEPAEKLARYSEFACHEMHVYLREKDPEFFRSVVLPYLANKADKKFLDHWLLGGDLARYLEPWRFAELNVFERILLLRGFEDAGPRHVRESIELLPPDTFALETYFRLLLASGSLEADRGLAGALENARDAVEKSLRQRTADAPASPGGVAPPAAAAREGPDEQMDDKVAHLDAFVLGSELRELSADFAKDAAEAESELQDARRREESRALFRALPPTAELAERNYWRVPIGAMDANLVTPSPFWLDFALTPDDQPFVSTRFALATRSSTEMLLALALLDLPFEAAEHSIDTTGTDVVFTTGSALFLAQKGIAEVAPTDDASPLLIGQDFFRLDEPTIVENGRTRDRFVSEEFLRGVPYGCRVVVTNPTSAPIDVEILLQIPEGSLPVQSGFVTRGIDVALDGYGSRAIEFAFYFPAVGNFRHYPAHVGQDGTLLAFAEAATLDVVAAPTTIDTTSWEHVSQAGDAETVFAFLDAANLAALDLSKLAWRMRDRAWFDRTIAYLRGRFVYDPTLWAYSLLHRDAQASREFLEQRQDVVALVGPWFASALCSVDPVARRTYQHLEYEPLVNARAHRFGEHRRILNASFALQYTRFLDVLAHKPALDDEDRMALTYYHSLQDRVQEALGTFAEVDRAEIDSALQYDYMRAYLAFYSMERDDARAIAESYADHPVDRWRARFRDVVEQLDEAEGKGRAGITDPTSRDQQQSALAATDAALEMEIEARRVTLSYANVTEVEVRYRPMDIELLFSTNPFMQSGSSSFASIKPNRVDRHALPADAAQFVFELPDEFRNSNVLVEVRAGGVARREAYYANDLAVQGLENYGQIAVRRASDGAPIPAAYVKVYARLSDGTVRFHKDGYSDLRGRFDYVSVSGMDGAQIERFAVLVIGDADGALVREFAPPQR